MDSVQLLQALTDGTIRFSTCGATTIDSLLASISSPMSIPLIAGVPAQTSAQVQSARANMRRHLAYPFSAHRDCRSVSSTRLRPEIRPVDDARITRAKVNRPPRSAITRPKSVHAGYRPSALAKSREADWRSSLRGELVSR